MAQRNTGTNFTTISDTFNRRWFVLILLYSLLLVSLKGYYYSRIFALIFFTLLLIIGNLLILMISIYYNRYFKKIYPAKYLVIGNDNIVSEIAKILRSSIPQFTEIIDIKTEDPEEFLSNKTTEKISTVISTYRDGKKLVSVQNWCDRMFVEHYISLHEISAVSLSAFVTQIGRLNVLKMRDEPLSSPFNRALKRGMDLLITFLIFIFLFIPFLLVYILLFIVWKKSPIYTQKRFGQTGKIFTLYKFRTIDNNKMPKICAYLRKYSIDEWPQFMNVFKGDMSIIGPRPYHLKDIELFKQKSARFMVRHWIKPGITGLAQVRGLRGEITDEKHFNERLENDVWYIENWSLTLDIKILFLSLLHVLKGEGK
ncbi:MAG: sugar transferase [Thermaurantimonas sp.]|uniref:sugar transferase n=1 Tax=Thermaurantimonas sp. TaxID=2681568 RepID=UPI00391AF7B2